VRNPEVSHNEQVLFWVVKDVFALQIPVPGAKQMSGFDAVEKLREQPRDALSAVSPLFISLRRVLG